MREADNERTRTGENEANNQEGVRVEVWMTEPWRTSEGATSYHEEDSKLRILLGSGLFSD